MPDHRNDTSRYLWNLLAQARIAFMAICTINNRVHAEALRLIISEIYNYTPVELTSLLSSNTLRLAFRQMDTIRDLFRLSSSSEASRSSQTEAIKSLQPIITIHLPGFGSVRMIEPSSIDNEPRQDYVVNGVLEIFVPQPLGRLRCRSINIGFQSILTLRSSAGYPEEETKLYETEAELRDSEDGEAYTYLEVGTQRHVQEC